jgi:hypothetical protein
MASIAVSPSTGAVGSPLVITGEGFANSTEVTVSVDGESFSSEIVSSANGNFGTDAIADHATGTLTATGQPSDTETLTIGTRVYTMRTGTGTLLPNEIRIGASASATLDNIKAAVNNGAGEGTTYGLGTARHDSVFAGQKTATTIVFFALVAGTAGNSIATTETLTNNSFGGGTLSGGAAAGAKSLVFTPAHAGTYTVRATDGTNSATTTVRVFTRS